jgi:hypothetical protein
VEEFRKLTDCRILAYYFYVKRDVMNRENMYELKKYAGRRPLFYIEDQQTAINPGSIEAWKKRLLDNSLDLIVKDTLPFCL